MAQMEEVSEMDIIMQIGEINLSGNVIPDEWYNHLRKDTEKPHTTAIIILAEIVYWYRPQKIKNTVDNSVTYRKRFKADKLQMSYSAFCEKYGFSKKQVTEAMHYLVEVGVISTEFRTIIVDDGLPVSNVLFIEVNPSRLAEICLPMQKGYTYRPKRGHPPPPQKGDTYTETTYNYVSFGNSGGGSPPLFKRKNSDGKTTAETTTEENHNPNERVLEFPSHFKPYPVFMEAWKVYVSRNKKLSFDDLQDKLDKLSKYTAIKAAKLIGYQTKASDAEVDISAILINAFQSITGKQASNKDYEQVLSIAKELTLFHKTKVPGLPTQPSSPRGAFPKPEDLAETYGQWLKERFSGWKEFNIHAMKLSTRSWDEFKDHCLQKYMMTPFKS